MVISETVFLSPTEYASRFRSRKPLEDGQVLGGLRGRFVRGTRPEHFVMLSDEPGKKLSWVCSPQQLGSLLGKTAAEAMVSVGFRTEWMSARGRDGTRHVLVLFGGSVDATAATWAGVWRLVQEHYGPKVDDALSSFRSAVEGLTPGPGCYDGFDPDGEISRLATLPVAEKHAHPGFLTAERFLAVPAEDRTLYHARGFLDHAVGCNYKFLGTGFSSDGEVETLVPNAPVSSIKDAVMLELSVTLSEIEELQRCEAVQRELCCKR